MFLHNNLSPNNCNNLLNAIPYDMVHGPSWWTWWFEICHVWL